MIVLVSNIAISEVDLLEIMLLRMLFLMHFGIMNIELVFDEITVIIDHLRQLKMKFLRRYIILVITRTKIWRLVVQHIRLFVMRTESTVMIILLVLPISIFILIDFWLDVHHQSIHLDIVAVSYTHLTLPTIYSV